MRIAFVGKGGSGKSTVASLFIQQLRARQTPVLAIDADINMHLAPLLESTSDDKRALSRDENVQFIRRHLRGGNDRIESVDHFVKTTPPGKGSNLIKLHGDDLVLRSLAANPDPRFWLLHVGTYEGEGIGVSCYHTSLSVLENVLSHALLSEDEWIVADMVAGTDAFSNTLHAQFDVLALVVEPTPEGVAVYRQYKALAAEGDVADRLVVIGNKVIDTEDARFLQEHVGADLIGVLPFLSAIKRSRQQGRPASDAMNPELQTVLDDITERAKRMRRPAGDRLKMLHALHRRYCKLSYIIDACGDIEGQIDTDFRYPTT